MNSQDKARSTAELRMRQRYGDALAITDWSRVAQADIWPDNELHWETILGYPFGPTALEIAIWWQRQLVGLAIATVMGNIMLLRFVEGRPGPDAPLKGQRVPVVLDVVIEYAQLIGRPEIRLKPNNEQLRNYYIADCGFRDGPQGQLIKDVEVAT